MARWITVVPETALKWEVDAYPMSEFTISKSAKYRITFNGEAYECYAKAGDELNNYLLDEAKVLSGLLFLGSISSWGSIWSYMKPYATDESKFVTSEPFCICSGNEETGMYLAVPYGTPYQETVTVKVEEYGLTSEEYKYMLFQHLRRCFCVSSEKNRYYTRDFFQKLLDGIEVTADSYNEFMAVLDDNMQYAADNDLTYAGDITQKMIDEQGALLIDAFAKIGITVVAERGDFGGSATFTKPDGTVMVYADDFYINPYARQEYLYAKKAAPYYMLKNTEVKELADLNFQMCGPDCYWSYDADTQTMTITGSGKYCGVTTESQMGSGSYSTIIFGAEVSELNGEPSSGATVVLLHSADFPLKVTSFLSGSKKYPATMIAYTDNEAFRAYDWASKYVTVEWHTLDEWEG